MKSIIATLFILCPLLAISQESEEPFKKANTILIQTNLSAEDTYRLVAQTFLKNGYSILNNDKELLFINTQPKTVKSLRVLLNAFVVGNEKATITLKGEYNIASLDDSYTSIQCWGMKGSATRMSWDEMQSVADKLQGKVLYTKNQSHLSYRFTCNQ